LLAREALKLTTLKAQHL